MNDLVKILEAATENGKPVSPDFLPLVYDELRILARQLMAREDPRQTLQPTALVHEAWLSISTDKAWTWNDRAHFFRSAALAMRHILVDRARAKASLKRGANPEILELFEHGLDIVDSSMDERILLVDELMNRLKLTDPETERLVTLKFFGGLTHEEIAAMEGVTVRTIERHWAYAKAKMFRMLQTLQNEEPGTV
ncbi:MAG: ECF-type sigma factor [Luteolibacter sp.]